MLNFDYCRVNPPTNVITLGFFAVFVSNILFGIIMRQNIPLGEGVVLYFTINFSEIRKLLCYTNALCNCALTSRFFLFLQENLQLCMIHQILIGFQHLTLVQTSTEGTGKVHTQESSNEEKSEKGQTLQKPFFIFPSLRLYQS